MQTVPSGFVVRSSDGAVCGHPCLQNLPFERTIRPWVVSLFPEAHFEECTDARVHGKSLNLKREGVIILQAPKGSGKSKAIREAVQSQLDMKTSVVQITFRRSLASSSAALLGERSTLYLDVQATNLSARHHPRLTVVVNSIARVRGTYDVVIIDEIVSVLDMLSGTLLDATSRVNAVANLARLVGEARTVVIADAMLDKTCVDFVLLCKRMSVADAATCAGITTNRHVPLAVADYTSRLHTDYQYVPYATLTTWDRALYAAVMAGKKVVVPCMTKVQAQRVADKFTAAGKRVLSYTGDTNPQVLQEHMRDIHAFWTGVDVLVYSPVITAGCSFELPHYDEVFFYGCAGVGSVRSAIQMLARVRDVRLKTVHVYLAKTQGTYRPVHIRLPDSLQRTPAAHKTHQECYVDLLRLLEEHQVTESACASHAFAYYFWVLVKHSGAQIVFPGSSPHACMEAKASPTLLSTDTSSIDVVVQNGPKEHWWCHDWSSDQGQSLQHAVEHVLDSAVAVSGTILERANKLHPDHLIDLEYVPAVTTANRKITTASGSVFPAWTTPENIERVRAWMLLIARKSAAAPGVTRTVVCPPGEWRKSPAAAFQNAIVHHPLISTQIRAVKTPEIAQRFQTHVQNYMDPSKHWMDVCADAWVLALPEASLRAPSFSAQQLFEPMPSTCITEAMLISAKVGNAFSRYDIDNVHVCAAAGCLQPAVNRVETTAAIVDFIITDKSGRVHLLHMRADNASASEHSRDVAKLCVLAAAEQEASGKPAASVAMLYLCDGSYVHVDMPEPLNPKLQSLATSGTSYVRAWHPETHAGFVVFESEKWHVLPPSSVREGRATPAVFASVKDVVRFMEVEWRSARRWISWGTCRHGLHDTYDLEAQVAACLRSPAGLPLDIHQCASFAASAEEALDPAADHDSLDVLRRVYRGICLRKFLVFFWNGKPHAIPCASLVFSG